MSSELEGRSEVGVVLQNAPQLRQIERRELMANLRASACRLSATRPNNR